MIAVANIWLFFYTPRVRPARADHAALFGFASHNWLGSQSTALGCLIVVDGVEGGRLLHDLLPRGAAVDVAAASPRPRRSRARRAGTSSAACTFPLLMPTTLFVLVNAVINAFRLVDHIVVMTARRAGQRDRAAAVLHLRGRLQLLGHGLRGGADDGAAGDPGVVALGSSWSSSSGCTTNERVTRHDRAARRARWRPPPPGCSALLWMLPLVYAFWTAFHPARVLDALRPARAADAGQLRARPGTAAPFARYFLNTVHAGDDDPGGAAGAVHAGRLRLRALRVPGRDVAVRAGAGAADGHARRADRRELPHDERAGPGATRSSAIGLPYMASAFGIFLLRQTFKTVPRELDEAARVEGCGTLQVLWRVYVPLARPVYLAYALVSVSYHWNNFLWPLIITNSVETRPLTVGLQVFSSTDQGIDWSIITAATLLTTAPLLIAFLLFQRQFVQSFMRAGHRNEARHLERPVVLRHRRPSSTRRASSPRRSGSPTSTCCACRRSPTTFRHRGSPAAPARTSSRSSRRCCPATRRCRASRGRSIPGATPRPARAPALRQPDPLAAAGAAGLPPPAAVSLRSRRAGHAADRRRGGRGRAVRRRARDDHPPRVLLGAAADGAGRGAAHDLRRRPRARARRPSDRRDDGGPFQTFVRPTATVITGDFNFEPDAPEHARMRAPFADGTPPLADCLARTAPRRRRIRRRSASTTRCSTRATPSCTATSSSSART